jgi:hypothetical protein
MPVPVKFTVCGLLLAVSLMLTVPVRVPDAWGVNVRLSVQVPLTPKLEPHVLEARVKSPLFVPPNVKPVKLRVAVPVLVIVTGCVALVVSTAWFENVRVVVERETAGVLVVGGVLEDPPPQPAKMVNPTTKANRRPSVAAEIVLELIAPPPP